MTKLSDLIPLRPLHMLAATILMLGLLPQSGYAENSETYESELVDWTIEVSGPEYVLSEAALEEYPHGRGERIYVTQQQSLGFVEISFFDDSDSPEQTIDVMMSDFDAASESFEVLESGRSEDISFGIARFELGANLTGYFYIEVAEDIDGSIDLAQSIYTLDADFLEQLSLARSEISMNGRPFLELPVLDLESVIGSDQVHIASTPASPVPEPPRSYSFELSDTELQVQAPIEIESVQAGTSQELVVLRSPRGFGLVGFADGGAESPEQLIRQISADNRPGGNEPEELYLVSDDTAALGVYRVHDDGVDRVFVVHVRLLEGGVWRMEAINAPETVFLEELDAFQREVSLNMEPFLGEVELDEIEELLAEGEYPGSAIA